FLVDFNKGLIVFVYFFSSTTKLQTIYRRKYKANEKQDELMPISKHTSDSEEEMSMESETELLNNSTKKDKTTNTN
ncbi:15684_t:CDS:2, partial [Cetraspora pellucida]